MKKITLFLLAVGIAISTSAQLITISETNQMPAVDDTVFYKDANTFGFDAAGTGTVTDKTWDFAALMDAGTTFYYFWKDAASTPQAATFPGANMARGNSGEAGYFYFDVDGNNLNRWGWYGSATNYGIYTSPGMEFHFPITAGNNFSSAYHGEMSPYGVGEDSVTISDGTISMQADMQGTLILPEGTLIDVLRIHVVETFHIKAWMMEMAIMDNVVEDDYYYWFHDTVPYPVMIYGTTSLDGSQQSEVLRYQVLEFSTPVLSDETDFLSFSFTQQTGPATINTTAHTIDIEVVNGTSLNALIPTFTLSAGASAEISSVVQVSGVTANNFVSPVTYTVTAEDGIAEQDWIVTVTEEPSEIIESNKSNETFYPNPTTGWVYYKGDAKEITVVDILGKVVISKKVVSDTTIIDLTNQAEGMYLLKTGGKTYKIIINR